MQHYGTQADEIMRLRKELAFYAQEGYELILADESFFNPDSYSCRHWMKSSEPIMKVTRFSPPMPKISVCCAISETYGSICNLYREDSYFDSSHMCELLQSIRDKLGPHAKIAMFWDNASMHRSQVTRQFAAGADIDIHLVFNIRYRCDLQPVEKVFRHAKHAYAKELEHHKAHNHPWQQLDTVHYIMDQIPADFIKSEAAKLHQLIGDASPTIPLDFEEPIKLGFVDRYESSPENEFVKE